MIDQFDIFLRKARESLAGAESEATNGRYNNCANRCYYACFQAAVAALMRAGIRPPGARGQWSHEFVPAQFVGLLINRRKMYPSGLRDILTRSYQLRQSADYRNDLVTDAQARRALRQAREFVSAIVEKEGSRS